MKKWREEAVSDIEQSIRSRLAISPSHLPLSKKQGCNNQLMKGENRS
jgi:hypothetical protein